MEYFSRHNRSGRVLAWVGACAVIALGMAPNAVWAADCRTDVNIEASAVPADNAGVGGHLAEHIIGMAPRAAVGNTAYPSEEAFTDVWTLYKAMSFVNAGSPDCTPTGTNNIYKAVQQANFGGDAIPMRTCTAVADGACSTWNNGDASSIVFTFRRDAPNGDWYILTSYPQP